jgi:hypothetical protein
MSNYIFLTNVGSQIVNEISLTKFIPNRRKKSNAVINYKVGLYTQEFDSILWKKIDEIGFNDNNNITLNSSHYGLDVGQVAVVVPCALDFLFLDSYHELPEPISRKSDLSTVNERASIYFYLDKSFSSYQGEFPYQMSRVKGSFLAFDALMHHDDKEIKTKIVFINIHSKKLNEKQVFHLNLANSQSKEKIISRKFVHNSGGIIDLPIHDGDELCVYSKDTLGIPIFISYNNLGYLSVEHSHPPAELFWNNKFKGQGLLKKRWLSELP